MRRNSESRHQGYFEPPLGESTYYTLDNYTRPFKVKVINDEGEYYVSISRTPTEEAEEGYSFEFDLSFIAERAFIGHDPQYPDYDGNSCLFLIGKTTHNNRSEFRYLYINSEIELFTTTEEIIDFEGAIGNNQVVYALAFSRNTCYLLSETVSIPRRLLPDGATELSEDDEVSPYRMFYNDTEENENFTDYNATTIIGRIGGILNVLSW